MSARETRYILYGRSLEARVLMIGFTHRGGRVRVITARPASRPGPRQVDLPHLPQAEGRTLLHASGERVRVASVTAAPPGLSRRCAARRCRC